MNELSLILQKEQEIKEKIEAAKKEADFALQEKRAQLENKLAGVCLGEGEKARIESAKKKRIEVIEKKFQEITQKEIDTLNRIRKDKASQAVDYLTKKISCLK